MLKCYHGSGFWAWTSYNALPTQSINVQTATAAGAMEEILGECKWNNYIYQHFVRVWWSYGQQMYAERMKALAIKD